MKIKHHGIVIDQERPFANCKLGREKYATILTSLVGNYADGFVLAINNEWGTGKTTFVKMWEQKLKNEAYKTLYFNAWENDFENGALTALMSELSTLQENGTKSLFKKVLAKGAILTKSALPILLKAAIAKHLDKDVLKELFEGVAENANELLQTQIQEYTSKKEGLKEFRTSLEEFVAKSSTDKPIVFIIDELDRCRPDYAVEVLEKIKHFFNVPGIVFVLSIDKTQLGNAIRGVYGSDRINADEYLRRFIDLEYSIPEPDNKMFCQYLFEYFEFDQFFNTYPRLNATNLNFERESFFSMLTLIFSYANLTLRQQEKIFAHSRIVLYSFNRQLNTFPTLLVCLIYLREFETGFYKKIKSKSLSFQDLVDSFEHVFSSIQVIDSMKTLGFTLAQLMFFYSNCLDPERKYTLIKIDNEGNAVLQVNSELNKSSDNVLGNTLKRYNNLYDIHDINLDYLTGRIDILENFISAV